MNNKLFVYGTLRNGSIQHYVPQVAAYIQFISNGFVYGKLFDAGEYPAAIKHNEIKLYGELLEIVPDKLDKVLMVLDKYEDFNVQSPEQSLFIRAITEVFTDDNQQCSANIYWYNNNTESLKVIEGGIYRK
jgi:gamma-glutamylcyclotransferase (GGCT)/AIG2-like uncharacterized protein YtfP